MDIHKRTNSVRYKLLTDMDDVDRIASEWDELLMRSRCNRAYSCSKWYMATVQLEPKLQPLVFTAYRNHVLSGILPLWFEAGRRLARFGDNYSDDFDIVAADEDCEVIEGLVALALQGTEGYNQLVLGAVKYESNFVRGAKAIGLAETIGEFFRPGNSLTYAVIDLTSGYDEYMKTLGRKFRLSLHRARNKATRDGLVVRELKPTDLAPDLLPETFLSLQLNRFGDRSDFKLAGPWLRKLFPALFMEQRIRVFGLLDQDRIVGIDLAAMTRSGMYSYPGGFLAEVERYDPGKLLIHHAIEQACLEGMAEYDLGWWNQDYKDHWRPTRREVGELRLATGAEVVRDR